MVRKERRGEKDEQNEVGKVQPKKTFKWRKPEFVVRGRDLLVIHCFNLTIYSSACTCCLKGNAEQPDAKK